MHRAVAPLVLVLVAASAGQRPAEALEAFSVAQIETAGRTVAAELVDVDGDGRTDLVEIRFDGIPPHDRRTLLVHFQDGEGGIPASPQLEMLLPAGAAAFDTADVLPAPGVELILLWREGLRVLSFAGREVHTVELRVPGGISAGPEPDERGLSRLPLSSRAFGPEPVLVVPGFSEVFLLERDGALRARLDVGGRANYFVQPPGLVYAESDIQGFFDFPRISIGDIDGDGRSDVLSSSRHELRVFLQRPDGGFAKRSSRRVLLNRLSLEDHVRASGVVRASAGDVDRDGRLDLVISATTGSLTSTKSRTSVHLNRTGSWDLDAPDFVLEHEKAMVGDRLLDIDGDGRLELLQGRVPVSVVELIEIFVTRSIDAHVALYPLAAGATGPSVVPRFERKLGIPMSFETGRLRGFLPSFEHDVNSDGFRDFVHSGDGSTLEVYLGGATSEYRERAARQALDVEGVLRAGDLDGDGLVDFLLFNPRRPGAPIRLLTNRGLLPGTPPAFRSAAGSKAGR